MGETLPLVVLWMEEEPLQCGLDTARIEAAGGVYRVVPCATDAERIAAARDATVLIVGAAPIGPELLKHAECCRGVIRCGIGYDCVDVAAATEQGICVANVPGYCVRDVAEYVIGMLFAVRRRICLADRSVRDGRWREVFAEIKPMRRVIGSTLGLVGYGRIGREVAQLAAGLGMRVIAYDPYVPKNSAGDRLAELVDFDELLSRSDVVSIHVPLTPETRGLFGKEAIARMKPGAILINTARGGIVDEQALADALNSGHLDGAAVDVFEQEPPAPDHPFWSCRRAVFGPHAASATYEADSILRESIADQVVELLSGAPPRHLLNPEVLSHPRCRVRPAGD